MKTKQFFSFFLIIACQTLCGQLNGQQFECGNDCDPCEPSCTVYPVTVDPCYSVEMLDRLNARPIKHLILMYRQAERACLDNVVLSAQARASLFYINASEKNRFAYLGRFPGNYRGNDGSAADINDFTLALTYSPVSWIHGYWELLHSDQITFSSDPRQGNFHTQKVYATFGNICCFPFYATIGKRDVGFGAMYTTNPFTPSITWHYFGGIHDGASIGYYSNGLHIEASALNGGRGIRVVDTNEKGKIDNWALNTKYEFCFSNWELAFGAGYLYSTIYDGNPPEHTGPVSVGGCNGVWTINAFASYNCFSGYIEVASTERSWEATGHTVQTFSAGLAYQMIEGWTCRPVTFSVEYGEGIQGPSGTEYHKNTQTVIGIEYPWCANARFAFEYIHTKGFAPLINLTLPGVSSSSAKCNAVLLGITLNI